MTEDDPQTYELLDGDRTFVFDGVLIGQASSKTNPNDSRRRWTEVRIYRTVGDQFVVEIVGRSTVTGEVDLSRAQVSETPEGAVECLHGYDDDGVRYITNTARRAADVASQTDESFRRAFLTERVA